MTKAFALNFSLKALFFASLDYKKRLPKLVRQPLFILRSDRDSNSGNGFAVYTLSRQLSPIVNDWLIISCLKPVPACAYVARKIYAAKLIIFFDVAITFAPFLSFFFLNVRDSIGC